MMNENRYHQQNHNQEQLQHRTMVKTNINNYQPASTRSTTMATISATTSKQQSKIQQQYEQKCTCCPYGYHIDLDFLRYLDSVRTEPHDVRTHSRKGSRPPVSVHHDRGVFSEDESTRGRSRETVIMEKRPDSACSQLPQGSSSRPYVVLPKAEPTILVAVPDIPTPPMKMRSEIFIDPEVEKKFRASTELFVVEKEGLKINGHRRMDGLRENISLTRRVADGGVKSGGGKMVDESSVVRKYRSSIEVVIEQLECCLGVSTIKGEGGGTERMVGKEDDVQNQLTRVQFLCSKIIGKLRHLQELEEKVKLIPDLDEHVLSLTRQLDQLKMKQQQQRLDDNNGKARSRITTRDVGVGNAVVFSRGGGSTSPTLKKFADISAPPPLLPPSPPPSSHSKKVREVSVQVSVPPVVIDSRRTSEKKLYMDYRHKDGTTGHLPELISEGSAVTASAESDRNRVCCPKCGSMSDDQSKTDFTRERNISEIISGFNKTVESRKFIEENKKKNSDDSIKLEKRDLFQTAIHVDLKKEPQVSQAEQQPVRIKKVPPAVAPKPKINQQKASSDPEIINMVGMIHPELLEKSEVPHVAAENEKMPMHDFNTAADLLKSYDNKVQLEKVSNTSLLGTDEISVVSKEMKDFIAPKESSESDLRSAVPPPVPAVRISKIISIKEDNSKINDDVPNLFIENHKSSIKKTVVLMIARDEISIPDLIPTKLSRSEVTSDRSGRTIVVDLLDSGSESDDTEIILSSATRLVDARCERKDNKMKETVEVVVERGFVENVKPHSPASECLISEITIDDGDDDDDDGDDGVDMDVVERTGKTSYETATTAVSEHQTDEIERIFVSDELKEESINVSWVIKLSEEIINQARNEIIQSQPLDDVTFAFSGGSSEEEKHPIETNADRNSGLSEETELTHKEHVEMGHTTGVSDVVQVKLNQVDSSLQTGNGFLEQVKQSLASIAPSSSSTTIILESRADALVSVSSSSSLSSSSSPPPKLSSSSSSQLKSSSKLRATSPRTPPSSLNNLEDENKSKSNEITQNLLPINIFKTDDSALRTLDVEEVRHDVSVNLFAEKLTSDFALSTTSDSSETETWSETVRMDPTDVKEQNLFINSQKFFLQAASGKTTALSDPGDLWKKKSMSSELTLPSSSGADDDDDDDYESSCSGTATKSCDVEAPTAKRQSAVIPGKIEEEEEERANFVGEMKKDEDSTGEYEIESAVEFQVSSCQSQELKDKNMFVTFSQSPPPPSSSAPIQESLTSPKSSSTITESPKSISSTEKRAPIERVRSSSSGSLDAGAGLGEDFEVLGSYSSTITSQSLDAGINEELAIIRNPCKMAILKSPLPSVVVTPSVAIGPSLVPGINLELSSDLSAFEEDEINNNNSNMMTISTGGGNEGDGEDNDDDESGGAGGSGTKTAKTTEDNATAAEEEEDCFLEACVVYANWLADPTSISNSEKDAILELIRKDWFLTSGRKMSQGVEVRNALSTMQNFGDLFVENVVNLVDADGNTTLHYAVSHGNGPVIEALLETGLCDVDRQNNAGYTSLMLAALLIEDVARNYDLLRALFDAGDIDAASDRSGQTALMLASSHGREEMVTLLLECGADINVQDEDGSTALMCASEHGHIEIIKILLSHPHCNSSLSDIDGSTALSIAMEEGNHDIGILIYAHMKAHGAIDDEEGDEKISQV